MLWGLCSSFAILSAIVYQNWQRSQVEEVQELIPNCLLTPFPLVFITGQRSLFYFMGYWNQIPHWLASHGYAVFHFALPWKNSQKRRQLLFRFLTEKSKNGEKFHLFLDESSQSELTTLLENHDFDCLASVTLIGHCQRNDRSLNPRLSIAVEETPLPNGPSQTPWFWFFHQLWTAQKSSLSQLGWNLSRHQGEVLLQRAQFLAERDLIQRQRSPNLKA